MVGIFPINRKDSFEAGSIICKPSEIKNFGIGRITSVTHSPALGHWIGLGLIEGGHEAWKGKTLVAADPIRNKRIEVEVVKPHMFDPEGVRMNG